MRSLVVIVLLFLSCVQIVNMSINEHELNTIVRHYLYELNSKNERFEHKHEYVLYHDFDLVDELSLVGKTNYSYAVVRKCKKCNYVRHIEFYYLNCELFRPFHYKWASIDGDFMFHHEMKVKINVLPNCHTAVQRYARTPLLSDIECKYRTCIY